VTDRRRQTADGHTSCHGIVCAMHTRRAVIKKIAAGWAWDVVSLLSFLVCSAGECTNILFVHLVQVVTPVANRVAGSEPCWVVDYSQKSGWFWAMLSCWLLELIQTWVMMSSSNANTSKLQLLSVHTVLWRKPSMGDNVFLLILLAEFS